MHLIKKTPLLIALAFMLVFNTGCSTEKTSNETITGYVVAITDGDTFTLLTKEKQRVKIRLHGIDCPERKQPFGQAAKQKLSDLVFNKNVRAEKTDIDRYGRTVAIIYDASNKCINEELLKDGLAWHYVKYDTNIYWEQLQNEAKQDKIGLWSDENATAPWNWRNKK